MLISIIIPTYNYSSVIARALESVLAQHDASIEILIIDDGSTDNTANTVEFYTQTFSFITYIKQENKGAASARNHGARLAKGDYLLFLDADDALLPEALQKFRQFIAVHPEADIIAAGHTSIEPNGKQRVHHAKALSAEPLKNFSFYLQKKISFSNGALLLKRYVLQKIHYPEYMRSNEDIPFFAHMLILFKCMSFPESVLAVHKHANSLRNQININQEVGLQVVAAVFNANLLPAECMQFRQEFYAQRCLSLFRSMYLAGKPAAARSFYWQAIRTHPPSIFQFSYLKKYLFSFFRNKD